MTRPNHPKQTPSYTSGSESRRALINGLYVFFQSRNPKIATVRWHGKFKARYRTKADALTAKDAWEKKGRIIFPSDVEKATPPEKPRVRVRVRQTGGQQEMRLS